MTDASSTERREQLRSLNDSLVSGSLSARNTTSYCRSWHPQPRHNARRPAQAQQPASSTDYHSSPQRNVRFADDVNPPAPEPIEAPPQYQRLAPVASASSGLQLRCPACGTSNDTARGPLCYVCNSRLTVADELSAATAARASSSSRQRWPIVTAMAPPSGAFSAAEDGRVVIHNGFFSCSMQTTQVIATAEGSACQVFVMCCTWQPRPTEGANNQQFEATWYVSQRFSQFERLHKALKSRLARSTSASLPPFPAKYHLTDRLEKRKQGLGLPELDEFLDISHQVQIFQSQRPSVNDPPVVSPAMLPSQSGAPPMDELELAQAEGAVRLLANAVRNARGDVRGDGTVQHHLDMCVQLAPGLQRSADVDNPFADAELIPRAMQCQEDLQQAVVMYNDALLAASG
ncbi:Phox homologous domain [Phytophthora cactorum]|nr:Phox homologous domain [Phytophthora cactorum]